MSRVLEGKVAIVTGAARGIGRAVALAYAGAGAAVVIGATGTAALESLAEEIAAGGQRAVAITGDVADPATAERLAAAAGALGGCDILVNAAAITGEVGPFETLDAATFSRVLEVNVLGTFLTCRAVLPAMKARGAGLIVNVASGLADRVQPGQAAYSASKAAVVQLTRVMAAEAGEHGVRVNVVHPGIVRTRMFTDLVGLAGEGPLGSIGARMRELDSSGVVLEPEQSARLFLWLASGTDITGAFVRMDDPVTRARVLSHAL